MTTFGLIHGANGAGAIWAGVVLELERRGHRAVAPDMPCDDVDARFSDYAATLRNALDGDEDAVIVGHSLGGCTCRLVPGRRHVYLAAMIPQPGRTLAECLKEEPMLDARMEDAQYKENHLRYWKREAAEELVFHDVPAEKHDAGFALLRGQSVTPYFEPCDAVDAPSTYVVCTGDCVVSPAWGRDAAPRLLGADVIEMPGGHAPQLSQAAAVADLLESL